MGLAFPKPRPSSLDRKDRKAARQRVDRAENVKVKARSGGVCEVRWFGATGRVEYRCQRRAIHVHHKLSGVGVRGRGASALAANKLHLCDRCHSDIHAHVLLPHVTDTYRRVR